MKPVREPDAGKPHVRFDEEGRETRDGPLGEWTPDPKGRKRWGAPDLYTTALALHSTPSAKNDSSLSAVDTFNHIENLIST